MNEETLLRKKRRNDRLASIFITSIGIGTILSVLAILFVITMEIIPLFFSSEAEESQRFSTQEPLMVGMDPWKEKAYSIDRKGVLREVLLKDGSHLSQKSLLPNDRTVIRLESGLDGSTTLVLDDGSVVRENIEFKPHYPIGGEREIVMKRVEKVIPEPIPQKAVHALSRINEEKKLMFARLDDQGKVHIDRKSVV